MYNFIQLFADCAEQIASVATSTIDAPAVEKRTNESMPPKMYNFNPEKNVTIDVVPPVEKYRDTRPIDVDSKYMLTEKNIVFISDSKDSVNNFYTHDRINDIATGQKSCVQTYDSDQVSSATYSDISQNSTQKQQNTSSDSKDGDRYDKKLNQPNVKPSISNVFNSLNEYINAPTGSLNYVEPMLNEVDDLSKRSMDNVVEKDFRLNKDVAINERSIPIEKGIMNIVEKSVMDHKNVLSDLGTFVKTENSSKQDNTMQNVMFYHSTPIQSDENNSDAIIPVSSVAISRHNNVTIDTKLSSNKDDVDKKVMVSDTFTENSDIISKQRQLDMNTQDLVDTFVENKESIAESTAKLNNIISCENRDKNVEPTKSDVFSNICMTHTVDTSDDFSEEELNQYLLELEKEESSKTENISFSDNTWLPQPSDELKSDREKSVSHCQRDDEDVNEAPIFEKIMIGELPKISQEKFQEKTKKFPVIDYNSDVCNSENITDAKCDNTVKIALNEKSNQLKEMQSNELDKTIKDSHVIEAVAPDIATQQSTLQAISGITVQEKVPSKFENIGEQLCSNSTTQKLQLESNRDTLSQDNGTNALLNLSENKEVYDKRVHCQDNTENNKDIIYETSTHNSEEISKMETASKISDARMVPHSKENDQEAEKPTRPQTLDIVLTHNKNDSHSGMSL